MLDARPDVRRRLGPRRSVRRLPRPDRRAERVAAARRAQHRVPTGRRARHRDERARAGVQRRASARWWSECADRHAPPLQARARPKGSRSTRCARASRADRRPGRPPPFRGERHSRHVEPAHRACDRVAQPRGAVPRRRRRDGRAGDGVHHRARGLRRRSRGFRHWTPSSCGPTGSRSSRTTRARSTTCRCRSDAGTVRCARDGRLRCTRAATKRLSPASRSCVWGSGWMTRTTTCERVAARALLPARSEGGERCRCRIARSRRWRSAASSERKGRSGRDDPRAARRAPGTATARTPTCASGSKASSTGRARARKSSTATRSRCAARARRR